MGGRAGRVGHPLLRTRQARWDAASLRAGDLSTRRGPSKVSGPRGPNAGSTLREFQRPRPLRGRRWRAGPIVTAPTDRERDKYGRIAGPGSAGRRDGRPAGRAVSVFAAPGHRGKVNNAWVGRRRRVARQATALGAYWNTDCIEGACGTLNGARPDSPGAARCLRAQIRPETAALTSGRSRSRGATGSGAASTTCVNRPPTSGRSTIRGKVLLGADGWAVFPTARCAGTAPALP